ncbi:zf-HC2 domain-containing protein [Catellatospora coxensis]
MPYGGDPTDGADPPPCPPAEPGGAACTNGSGPTAAGLYLTGALSPDQAASFESHLLRCPACQDYCDRVGPAIDLLIASRYAEAADLAAPEPSAS